jgi:hypothetical protein
MKVKMVEVSLWRRFIQSIETQIARGGLWIFVGLVVSIVATGCISKAGYLLCFGDHTDGTVHSVVLTHTRYGQPSRYQVTYSFIDGTGKQWNDEETVDDNPLLNQLAKGLVTIAPSANDRVKVLFLQNSPSVHMLADNFDPAVEFIMAGTGIVVLVIGIKRRRRTVNRRPNDA